MTDARILDRGYRPYDGIRRGPMSSARSLGRHTAQRVMGIKRPARAKILPFMCAAIAYVPAIVFIGIAAIVPDSQVRDDALPTYGQYYTFIASALVVFVSLVAPEALCPDRRTGLLGLYLAAPLTRATYLASKAATVLSILLVATLGPPLLMLIAFVLQGIGPDGPGDVVVVLLRVLAAGLMVGALYTSISLGVSSLTDKRALAAAGTLMLLVLSGAVAGILYNGVNFPSWILAFSLTGGPFMLVQRIFGESDADPVVNSITTWVLAFAVAGWTVLGASVAWWRYRTLRLVR
jgi:ABC-2 type transport system permease protein